MKLTWRLAIASFKMYFRQREAVIWTFLLPLFIVGLFSFVQFGGVGSINVGVVDESGGRAVELIDGLKNTPMLGISSGGKDQELAFLDKGDRDIVVVIPAGFQPGSGDTLSSTMQLFFNEAKPQQVRVGSLLVQRILDEAAMNKASITSGVSIRLTPVKSRNLTYIDYLLPGVISMSIMQLGVFGVAFGFVSLKRRGILRRLSVTPVRPSQFIVAQVATRVFVVMLQIVVMIGVGVLLLHFHFIGNLATLFLLGVLGAIVFLGIGFAIAGISKSEDQVAPIANVVTLPMMLLSGVFFSRSSMPGFVRHITDLFPLSFLADSMRAVAIDGASLVQVLPDVGGLVVWGVVTCFVAAKCFRWE